MSVITLILLNHFSTQTTARIQANKQVSKQCSDCKSTYTHTRTHMRVLLVSMSRRPANKSLGDVIKMLAIDKEQVVHTENACVGKRQQQCDRLHLIVCQVNKEKQRKKNNTHAHTQFGSLYNM